MGSPPRSSGTPFEDALSELDGPFERLDDDYPDWHPAPYKFDGILKLFLYRETTGWSYRDIIRRSHLIDVFDLDEIPTESAMSRAWRSRLDNSAHKFIAIDITTIPLNAFTEGTA